MSHATGTGMKPRSATAAVGASAVKSTPGTKAVEKANCASAGAKAQLEAARRERRAPIQNVTSALMLAPAQAQPEAGSQPGDDLASEQRRVLVSEAGIEALALEAEKSVRPRDALEGMLIDELALAHNAAVRLMARASQCGKVEPMVQLTAAASKMLAAFREGLVALNRIRHGDQRIVIERVDITQGGQAVIGNVQAGGHHGGV